MPALEAMCCGAPVIAANTSSLPEVIGLEDALFDPHDVHDMANKIERVLTDSQFRQDLLDHHQIQQQQFSWDISGKKAIQAFEAVHARHTESEPSSAERLKLAYVSPLPPERSGISDYSAELLPYLSRYYDIDVIVEQGEVKNPWILELCSIVDVSKFKATAHQYDRVLYHFGNSSFHQHMFELLNEVPGVVVLHDFYLSGVLNWMSVHKYNDTNIENELFYSHGNAPFNNKGADLILDYPCNKKVLDGAKGLIFHSDHSNKLLEDWYGKHHGYVSEIITLLREPAGKNKKNEIRQQLGFPENAIITASFGLMGRTKQNIDLLEAWLASEGKDNTDCYLVFVGQNNEDGYGKQVEEAIENSGCSDRVIITGWTESEEFKHYLIAADIGVQLRTLSRGETSASVLDCMNYGLATIVNANGSMVDLDDNAVTKLEDEFQQTDLVDALNKLLRDKNERERLGRKAISVIKNRHDPEKCAYGYMNNIEDFYDKNLIRKEEIVDVNVIVNKFNEASVLLSTIYGSSSWRLTCFIRKIFYRLKLILRIKR